MYQVSTLQALLLGYSRAVISVSELLSHGNIGLGTFTDVDGEMIVLDGSCYRALENGDIVMAEPDRGVPFSTVCTMSVSYPLEFDRMDCIESVHVDLKTILEKTQKAFKFENVRGTLVCVYFPDYMDGINASGWHLHFISIELKLPDEPIFDTFALKQASKDIVKAVEQGKGE